MSLFRPVALVSLFVLLAATARADGLPYTVKFQIFDGPHSKTGQDWKSKTIEIKPGTDGEREFIANYSKSNPGLVQSYQELVKQSAFTDYLKADLALKGTRPTITLVDDSKKYVDRNGDGQPDTDDKAHDEFGVWPHASGNNLFISQSYLGTYPNLDSVHHLLIHELSHTQDDTSRDGGDYGPDGTHFGDEAMFNHDHKKLFFFGKDPHYSTKAAFLEGWAEYMALAFNPSERSGYVADVGDIRQETSKGDYEMIDWGKASFNQLASVEHVNSLILFDVNRYLPDGQQKIFEAFKDTNRSNRDLVDVLHDLIEKHPEDAYTVAAIYDAYTGFKADDGTLDRLLGKELSSKYRGQWRKKAQEANPHGTLAGAEGVGRWAAANTQIAAAQDGLQALDKQIEDLGGWDVSPWDLLGGAGSFLVRNFLHHRERDALILRRKALAAELEQLQAQPKPAHSILGSLLIPPPAAPDPSDGERPTSAAPAKAPGGKPASGVEGAPVEWGR